MYAEDFIKDLALEPHQEGGFYRETFRSDICDGTGRACATSILFLLTSDNPSNLHKLDAEEIWYYHSGSPLTVHMIDTSGNYTKVQIGPDIRAGQVLQAVIPAGIWFGSSCDQKNGFALVGCVVAPGFTFEGFELAQRSELLESFPQHAAIITHLTR